MKKSIFYARLEKKMHRIIDTVIGYMPLQDAKHIETTLLDAYSFARNAHENQYRKS